jgi:PAS domain S-box-containing protein
MNIDPGRIFDALPGLMWAVRPDKSVEFLNSRWLEYTGLNPERIATLGWHSAVHPDDLPTLIRNWSSISADGGPGEMEARLRRHDGQYRWFLLRATPYVDPSGEVAGWHGTDVDDQKRAAALLEGERRLLEMVATGKPLSATLNELCLLVQALCTSCSCSSILLLDSGTQKLWHAASPCVPKAYTDSIDGFSIGPDVSSCGTAAFHGSQVVAADIAVDSRWASFREVALDNGLRACWSTPIFSQQGRVLGTFAIFSGEPGEPSVRDQEVIAQVTHLASIAIERERSQNTLESALEALRASEGRMRTIVDAIPTIAWYRSADGSGEFLNKRWHDYAGVARTGAAQSIIHPKDERTWAEAWEKSLSTETIGEVEVRMRRYDGACRWHLSRFEPFRDPSGRITGWYGADTDIDDAKRAEALLRGETRLLELVAGGQPLADVLKALCTLVEDTIEGSFSSVVLVDPSGNHLEHGAAPSLPPSFINALVGRPVNVKSGPCAMAAYLNEQIISADFTTETRWSDYQWSSMALTHGLRACWSTPIPSTAGKPLGAFAIYYEEPRSPTAPDQALIAQITHIASIAIERAQNQAALMRSEAFLTKAQRLSSSGSFSWRIATDELMFSAEYCRIFELDPGRPVTVPLVLSRVHPDDAPALTQLIDRARREGLDFDLEHRLVMSDGSTKFIYMVAHRTTDADGEAIYIGAVQDVTRRRRSEESLERVRSELARVARVTSLGALTASIAHEVNQPLFGITTNASTCVRMLGGESPNLDGAREMARRIIRDGNRASEVIARLREMFVKRDSCPESVDLNAAAREVIALLMGELQRAKVIVRTELAEGLPEVTGDRVQLQQVILNLCLNAADAMSGVEDRPRALVLKTALEGEDCVRLSVEDAGVGFEPGTAESLFDAFYTTKPGGMGIGLSISRSIIENHRGQLRASPNTNSPGATFSLSIPREIKSNGSALVRAAQCAASELSSNA